MTKKIRTESGVPYSPEQRLWELPHKKGHPLCEPVNIKLGKMVEEAGLVNAKGYEIIGALVTFNAMSSEELEELVIRYRKSTVADLELPELNSPE